MGSDRRRAAAGAVGGGGRSPPYEAVEEEAEKERGAEVEVSSGGRGVDAEPPPPASAGGSARSAPHPKREAGSRGVDNRAGRGFGSDEARCSSSAAAASCPRASAASCAPTPCDIACSDRRPDQKAAKLREHARETTNCGKQQILPSPPISIMPLQTARLSS